MTEAEVLQLSFSANEAVASLFSIFFAIVSAYIAGLYFFIHRAPTMLKVIGFVFIGQSMSGIEVRILGLVEAWEGLQVKTTSLEKLNHPIFPAQDILDWAGIKVMAYDGNRAGIYTGWSVSMLVYVALFYATFVYSWPVNEQPGGSKESPNN